MFTHRNTHTSVNKWNKKNCSLKTHLSRISSLFPQTNDITKHKKKDLETCHIFSFLLTSLSFDPSTV